MIEIERQISAFISNSIRLPDILFSINSSTGYCQLQLECFYAVQDNIHDHAIEEARY